MNSFEIATLMSRDFWISKNIHDVIPRNRMPDCGVPGLYVVMWTQLVYWAVTGSCYTQTKTVMVQYSILQEHRNGIAKRYEQLFMDTQCLRLSTNSSVYRVMYALAMHSTLPENWLGVSLCAICMHHFQMIRVPEMMQ